MVDTIKFSQMTSGGDIENDDKVPGLKGGGNVLFNNPWTFLPPGNTAQRPAPSATVNYRLRFNTEEQLYEYYDAILGAWTQLQESLFKSGPFVIYEADPSIPDAQNLGALANGILKQTIAAGVATLDIAVPGTDYYAVGSLDFLNTYKVFNAVDPTNPQDYATKNYVDQNSLTGTSVYAASAGTLGTVMQIGSGVGAQLINAGTQAALELDGATPPMGVNVLIKNTATGMTDANEGVYNVTDPGSASTNWVLTRSTNYDTPTEINNTGLIIVQNGNTLAGTAWYNTNTIGAVDVTSFNYVSYGIAIPVPVAAGGTGLTSTTANQLLYSSANNVISGLATANNGVLVTSGAGVPSISSTLPSSLTIPAPLIGTGLCDSNGALALGIVPIVGTPVNYMYIQNSPTGFPPYLSAAGADTNVTMTLLGKGTGGVAIQGTGTNDNAPTGYLGEYLIVNVPVASAVSISPNIPANVAAMNVTGGDWDVFGVVNIKPPAIASVVQVWISSTSATVPDASLTTRAYSGSVAGNAYGHNAPYYRVSTASPLTIYLEVLTSYASGSSSDAYGTIYARRRR